MQHRVIRVGLTGGIATGKSFCLRRFAELGAPTIDSDVVARAVVEPGTPGFHAVVARFGPGMLTPEGVLDRAALGRLVFADAAARRDLERIVHPLVYETVERWLSEQAAAGATSGQPRPAIAAIPLLYETGQEGRFDRVIVAACPEPLQIARLMTRDRLSEEDARRRVAAQMPIEEKRRRADIVIDTAGTVEETTRQVDRVWADLTA